MDISCINYSPLASMTRAWKGVTITLRFLLCLLLHSTDPASIFRIVTVATATDTSKRSADTTF